MQKDIIKFENFLETGLDYCPFSKVINSIKKFGLYKEDGQIICIDLLNNTCIKVSGAKLTLRKDRQEIMQDGLEPIVYQFGEFNGHPLNHLTLERVKLLDYRVLADYNGIDYCMVTAILDSRVDLEDTKIIIGNYEIVIPKLKGKE